MSLVEVPIGYNLRGKTIRFTRTELLPAHSPDDYSLMCGLDGPTPLGIQVIEDGGVANHTEIRCVFSASQEAIVEVIVYVEDEDGWILTEVTFPDTRDYIIESNNLNDLGPGNETYWGFSYAFVN